jgi:hypothetical protein
VFHDNNRDINYSQVSMRALLDWYLQWHPPIVHDLHESLPFLFTFSGQAPHNPNLDPILYGELPVFANFEMAQLTKYGMPGVWTHAFVDMWSPGYLAFMASNHNGMVRMYETFGNGGATTMTRRLERADADAPTGSSNHTSREWYRPSPPYKEVEWSMRNNTNYMQTAVLSGLQFASAFPQMILENFYLKSRHSIEAGVAEPPHAYIVPAGQADRTKVARLVNLLRTQAIEVGRTAGELKLTDGVHPAGSFVIKRNQPYGRLAKTLLEKQTFPDPALRSYDDTAWTMGLMLHTEVKPTVDRTVLDADVELLKADVRPVGVSSGERHGTTLMIPNHGSPNLITLRHRLLDVPLRALESSWKHGRIDYPAGTLVVASPSERAAYDRVVATASALGLDSTGLPATPPTTMHEVDLPRMAVYSTWGSTQEVGWVRHALDQFEVSYDLIYKERVRKGRLRDSYDVILIPSQGRTGRGLVYDIERRGKPLPYTRTPEFPSHGMYGESEDIRGGMGLEGVLELQTFLEAGGTIVTLGAASYFPAEFGLSRTVGATRPSAQFYAPGPIVQAEIARTDHPLFYGYAGKSVPVRYANGPLLQVPEAERDEAVLMRFSGGDESVLSGLMKGASEIRHRPAIVETTLGRGRLIMFATNPCYRWQNHGEFAMLFNAILHWNDRPAAADRKTPTVSAARTGG